MAATLNSYIANLFERLAGDLHVAVLDWREAAPLGAIAEARIDRIERIAAALRLAVQGR